MHLCEKMHINSSCAAIACGEFDRWMKLNITYTLSGSKNVYYTTDHIYGASQCQIIPYFNCNT